MLEQEFPIADVRRKVAEALRPKPDAGLGPHSSLIDLSRAPDGTVRLVTTNFDRVFEQADPSLTTIVPPTLPDPLRTGALNGILHLHGKVTLDYSAPEGPEFVLSSADFGRAYLADGWATTFIRGLMGRYRIVFVGYSADDPPIQYLLEALQPSIAQGQLYAFQEGDRPSATGLWRHKGVSAIPFQGFDTLWRTLEAWASRARDPDSWRRQVAKSAACGPRALLPHERGQVAHLVSSSVGAAAFAEQEPAPPAEWLCTFDPLVRYDHLRSIDWRDPDQFDPFESYHLDGETPPSREQNRTGSPAVPSGSWSAFEAAPDEHPSGQSLMRPSMRGPSSTAPAQLSGRLWRLTDWLGKVVADPVSIWWASGQNALHPEVINHVRRAIMRDDVPAAVRTAWRLIFAALEEPSEQERDLYDLAAVIDAEGWSHMSLVKLIEAERPRLIVRRPMTAPIARRQSALQLVRAEVNYPGIHPELSVPAEFLLDYIAGVRRNLLLATRFEQEVGGYALSNLRPLKPFESGPNEFVSGSPDLSSLMAHLSHLVVNLSETDLDAAVLEVAGWRSNTGAAFRNLRVWAAANSKLTSAVQAADILLALDEDIWDSALERDFLTALEARWIDLSEVARQRLEAATLTGPQPWKDADPIQFEHFRINAVLRRLLWMSRGQLPVSFALHAEMERLKLLLPSWDPSDAIDQLDRSWSRSGWVDTDKAHDSLLSLSLDAVLDAAQMASGRGRDPLTEARPFLGLVESRPVKALAALRRAASREEPWSWAWTDFMWSDAREKDEDRFRCYITRLICKLPLSVVEANLRSFAWWFTKHTKSVWRSDRQQYLTTWQFLVQMVAKAPEAARSGIAVEGRHDWITSAINSPPGRLADQLFDELRWGDEPHRLDEVFRERVDALLALPPGPRALAAAPLAMRMNWFFAHDRAWTEKNLLALLETDPDADVRDAARAGFLYQSNFPDKDLYIRVSPMLLALFAENRGADRPADNLRSLILAGWYRRDTDGERLLSSDDFREALLVAGEYDRIGILRLVGNWVEESEECAAQTVEFIQDVWPRQLAARSPSASTALVSIALRAGDRMPEVTAAVLPVLETTAEPIDSLPYVHRSNEDRLSKFPEQHLALLFAILPEDAARWPWGIHQVIERLSAIDAVRNDPRLTDLRRRLARG
jgi:hypothetical protein